MSRDQAEKAVTISALIVAAVYGYRRLTEATSSPVTLKKLAGVGDLPALGAFATAWGFTFLVIAGIAEASPAFGGAFAILVATADLLGNTPALTKDIGQQEGAKSSTSATAGQNVAGAVGTATTAGASSVTGNVFSGGGSSTVSSSVDPKSVVTGLGTAVDPGAIVTGLHANDPGGIFGG